MQDHEVLSLLSEADETAFKHLVEKHDLAHQVCVLESWRSLACQHAFAGREEDAVQIARLISKIGQLYADENILAISNWTYGNIYTITDKATQALIYYKCAEAFHLKSDNWLDLARMRVGEVGVLNSLGRYKDAIHLAEESWPLLASSPERSDQSRLAGLANNLAVAYEYLGRYEEALELYERKIQIWQQQPTTQSAIEIARTRINIGVLKKRFNLLVEAQRELLAGKEVLSSLEASANYRLDLIRAELHLVELYEALGASAQEIHQAQATVQATAVGLNDLLNLKIAQTRWQLDSPRPFSEVKEQLLTLKKHVEATNSTRDIIKIHMLLARHAYANGDVQAAIAAYQQACETAVTINDWELLYLAQHDLGRLYLQMEDIPSAKQSLINAIEVIEKTQQKLKCQELRSIFIDDKLTVYRDLIHACFISQDYENAFYWIECARARELVQSLINAMPVSSRSEQHLPSGERQDRNGRNAQHNNSSRKNGTLKRESRSTLYPSSYITPMHEAQASLAPDTLLLTFSFIEDQLWVFPLINTGFLEPRLLVNIPSQAKLQHALTWLRMPAKLPIELVQRRAPMLIVAAQETLAELYQQFMAPLEDWLQDYLKLIIVPDGYLFHLPFACLYNSKNKTYLAETHELRLIPSTTAWQLNTNTPRLQERSVAFAYAGDTLEHISQEIQSIREANQDFIVFSGSDAVTHIFHGELVKSAKYIHLASHAIFRQDNPLFSFVQLADGPLEAQEILQLKLNATLVVLSACETGRGLFRGGDYWGLTIAFLLAGAQSVLATHWRVDDAVTANVMKDFYGHLANGHSSVDALRKAQLACLGRKELWWQHPFYWAPFFMVSC